MVATLLPKGARAQGGRAQAAGDRALQSVEAERADDGWHVELRFSTPFRYVRHSPREATSLVVIELQATGMGRTWDAQPLGRQGLRPFEGREGPPIVEVITEPVLSKGRVVEIRFNREIVFEISQGKDLRVLQLVIPEKGNPADETRAAALLEAARRAMSESDTGRAVQLYTKVLSLDAPSAHPEALEMLGLARERSGQRAHARAEYERFLMLYPDHEDAARVRQRLQTLSTASSPTPERPRRVVSRDRRSDARFDLHGGLSSYYSRSQFFMDDGFGDAVYDSSWINDLFLNARMRKPEWELEASASGRTRIDFQDEDIGDDSRLSSVLVEGAERGQGWWGNLGRQRGGGGIIGRFDGARLGYRLTDSLDLHVLGGFPLETYSSDGVNTDRFQVGGVGQVQEVFSFLDMELYTNYQNEDDLTYRAALGGEFRHLRDGRSIVASIDYDAYFNAVNFATLLADVEVVEKLNVNTLIEYRKSPILTLGNALIGQSIASISGLHEIFSASEMKDLAEDRTADATNFTLGARYELNPRFDLSANWTASKLSGTSSSGGVTGFSGTGYDYSYFVQLAGQSLLMDRGVSTVGLRIFDGGRYDSYMFQLNGRYPVAPSLRLNPIIRLEYVDGDAELVRWVPRLRLDYIWRQIILDLDVAFEMLQDTGDGSRPNEYGYSLLVGLRYDF